MVDAIPVSEECYSAVWLIMLKYSCWQSFS